jgi:hypothetical protein
MAFKNITITCFHNPEVHTGKNHLSRFPDFVDEIYDIRYRIGTNDDGKLTYETRIRPEDVEDIVIYEFDDGVQVWENAVERELRNELLNSVNFECRKYEYGYVAGTHAPYIEEGMQSASETKGYIFWQIIHK